MTKEIGLLLFVSTHFYRVRQMPTSSPLKPAECGLFCFATSVDAMFGTARTDQLLTCRLSILGDPKTPKEGNMSQEDQKLGPSGGGGNIVWPWTSIFGGDDNPSPFPQSFRGAPLLVRELVGRLVRIVQEGDVVTADRVAGRVTVYVKKNNRIAEITIESGSEVTSQLTHDLDLLQAGGGGDNKGGTTPWPFAGSGGGTDNPSPWLQSFSQTPALIRELMGRPLRIIEYPDHATADKVPGRVTIFRDQESRIADIWVEADLPTV
ncbi:hypothetical protein [Cupriavidus necator]|uniref:hypothetical protein n=1 Tax=Cupriavidus necator TaxID=106590 RepID=UPI0011600590|nr:hypothetical protein [Cupriavidus necator]